LDAQLVGTNNWLTNSATPHLKRLPPRKALQTLITSWLFAMRRETVFRKMNDEQPSFIDGRLRQVILRQRSNSARHISRDQGSQRTHLRESIGFDERQSEVAQADKRQWASATQKLVECPETIANLCGGIFWRASKAMRKRLNNSAIIIDSVGCRDKSRRSNQVVSHSSGKR